MMHSASAGVEAEVLPAPVWTVEVVTARATIEFDFAKKGDAERLANQIAAYPSDTMMRVVHGRGEDQEIVWVRPALVAAVRVTQHV